MNVRTQGQPHASRRRGDFEKTPNDNGRRWRYESMRFRERETVHIVRVKLVVPFCRDRRHTPPQGYWHCWPRLSQRLFFVRAIGVSYVSVSSVCPRDARFDQKCQCVQARNSSYRIYKIATYLTLFFHSQKLKKSKFFRKFNSNFA